MDRNRIHIFSFLLLITFFCVGGIRYSYSLPNIDSASIHNYQDENSVRKIKGIISDNPDKRRD